MQYRFKMPIGDWSDDGHGKCDWFEFSSNKPVEEVREIHFRGTKETFDIHAVCNEYGESTYSGPIPKWAEKYFDKQYNDVIDGPVGLANLWADMLMQTDPTLNLTLVQDSIEMLPFYGFDSEKRHIEFVGYGLFE